MHAIGCDSAPGASQLAFALVIASVVAFVVVKDTEPEALDDRWRWVWLVVPTTALQVALLGASSTMARYPVVAAMPSFPQVWAVSAKDRTSSSPNISASDTRSSSPPSSPLSCTSESRALSERVTGVSRVSLISRSMRRFKVGASLLV